MKSNILFILHLPPPIHGAAMMGKYIKDSYHINDNYNCEYINLTTAQNLSDLGVFSIKKIINYFKLLYQIYRKIKTFNPSLVYITPNTKGVSFYKDFIVVQLVKIMKSNIVVHFHNKGVADNQNKIFDNFLYKIFFKNIKVILVAKALTNDIKKYVSKKDIYICPNGIPEKTQLTKNHNKNSIPKLLFLSNLLISKGVFILLDACKILKERGYKFICNYVGGESAEIDLYKFKSEVHKRNLDKYVKYEGKKYGKDKDFYFQTSDIFVFPTYNETFGLVNLEAMEYSLPIISTNEGGIPDIIIDGETGYIVEKQNAQLLAEKIQILLNNEKLRYEMGVKGNQRFKSLFTLNKFEIKMKNILDDCLNEIKTSKQF